MIRIDHRLNPTSSTMITVYTRLRLIVALTGAYFPTKLESLPEARELLRQIWIAINLSASLRTRDYFFPSAS